MAEFFVFFFLIIGTIFIFIGSLGLLKMPDVYLRMSASTIAGTFGVASMLIAAAIHFFSLGVTLHIIGVIVFLILTVPIGAHMMGRAATIISLPKWEKMVYDDAEGKYNEEKNVFEGLGASSDNKQESK
jgi:multicomponent Na+:H+ antiporter subunit G